MNLAGFSRNETGKKEAIEQKGFILLKMHLDQYHCPYWFG
jgi:hypothetical protein